MSTALTVPVTTLGLAVLGGLALARRRRDQRLTDDPHPPADAVGTSLKYLNAEGEVQRPARASWLRPGQDVDRAPGAFIAAQIFGPMAVLAIPSTPIFGGVKHFFASDAVSGGRRGLWLGLGDSRAG